MVFEDRFIAVSDVSADARAGRAAPHLSKPLNRPERNAASVVVGAKPGVVKRHLFLGVNGTLWTNARRTKQLVDVAEILVRPRPSSLPGSVGEDDDVFWNLALPFFLFIGRKLASDQA